MWGVKGRKRTAQADRGRDARLCSCEAKQTELDSASKEKHAYQKAAMANAREWKANNEKKDGDGQSKRGGCVRRGTQKGEGPHWEDDEGEGVAREGGICVNFEKDVQGRGLCIRTSRCDGCDPGGRQRREKRRSRAAVASAGRACV